MAVPTITGSIRRVDDTPYTGKLTFYRMVPAMFNGSSLVVLSQLVIQCDSSGEFTTALQPGVYEVETCVSKYPGVPWSRVRVRVPNTDDEINFSDLELENSLPHPSFFGGDSGGEGGGSVDVATTTTAGIVKIDQADGNPTAITKKTVTGSDGLNIIFRPIAGKFYIRNSVSFEYHELLCATVGGVVNMGVSENGVSFASLPAA